MEDYEYLEEKYMGHTKESAAKWRRKYKQEHGVDPYVERGRQGGKVKRSDKGFTTEQAKSAAKIRWSN